MHQDDESRAFSDSSSVTTLVKDKLIVALDVPSKAMALEFASPLVGVVSWLKIGLELFVSEGPDVVRAISKLGFRIMLDLKLHDIPKTVERSVAQAVRLNVDMLTLHTAGGASMLRAARQGAGASSLRLLGVTVLTSQLDEELKQTGVAGEVAQVVMDRATLAADCGLHGVVASAWEAHDLRQALPADFAIVTPGIRMQGDATGDQVRIATPAKALRWGASHLVVGRPVRDAADPVVAANTILKQMEAAS